MQLSADLCLSFCPFSFVHCVVLVIVLFWSLCCFDHCVVLVIVLSCSLCCLGYCVVLVIVLFVLRLTASDHPLVSSNFSCIAQYTHLDAHVMLIYRCNNKCT